MKMVYSKKFIFLFAFLAGTMSAQKPWFEGNLKGLHRYHVTVKAVGIEHLYSEPELKTFVESKLIQYHVKVSQKDAFPRMSLYIETAEVKQDSISQFLVELSVYDFSATVDQVIEQFNFSDFQKDFQVSKLYENQSIGSSAPEELKHAIEQVIINETDRFLNQWRQDNPFKKF